MSTVDRSKASLVLIKHAQPLLDPDRPPREWTLGDEGVAQARSLAERLRDFLPCVLVSSPERKAHETALIVGETLQVPVQVAGGLEEIDRPAMPILSGEEHDRFNVRLFEARDTPVVGHEPADIALQRFRAAMHHIEQSAPPDVNIVVVSHGTVISLFVELLTGRDALTTWRTLACAELITLSRPLLHRDDSDRPVP
jgi:broad specificity phosphatase PhoE